MLPIVEDVERASQVLSTREREALSRSGQLAQSNISRTRWTASFLIGLNLFVAAAVLWMVFRITRTLRRAVVEMSRASDQVVASIDQVTAASSALAQGAGEQKAAIQETSSTSAEIDSMARRNGEHARTAAELVTRSQREFANTNGSLEATVGAIADINSQSDKISKIIKVVFRAYLSNKSNPCRLAYVRCPG